MTPPIVHTIGQTSYRSDTPPTDVPSDCEALLCAAARREIPDLAILREWHRQMPGWAGILGAKDADVVGKWALRQFAEAAFFRDRPRLNFLISAGLHHVGCLSNGVSALRVVAGENWPDGIADLVAYGGDVGINRTNFYAESTLLIHCGPTKASEFIQLLLSHGADFDVRDSYGRTALHHCANSQGDCFETIKVLVAAGASISDRTPTGETSLDLVRRRGHQHIVDFMAQRMDETEPGRFDRFDEAT